MSCLTKAKLWLFVYWANVGLLVYAIVRLLLAGFDQWSLAQMAMPVAAVVGAFVSMAVTRYWQQASIVPPPADMPADASPPAAGDHTLSLDNRPIAIVRKGIMPDGGIVWYRSTPPPGFLTPWQCPHPEAGLLRPRTVSYYDRKAAICEAEEAIRLRH